MQRHTQNRAATGLRVPGLRVKRMMPRPMIGRGIMILRERCGATHATTASVAISTDPARRCHRDSAILMLCYHNRHHRPRRLPGRHPVQG